MKDTVSGVVEDLKFKISEGSDPNWCFPDSAQLAPWYKKFLKNPESAKVYIQSSLDYVFINK